MSWGEKLAGTPEGGSGRIRGASASDRPPFNNNSFSKLSSCLILSKFARASIIADIENLRTLLSQRVTFVLSLFRA